MFDKLEQNELNIIYIVGGVGAGLIVILVGVTIWLGLSLRKLKRGAGSRGRSRDDDDEDDEEEDADSQEGTNVPSERQTYNNQPYNQHVYQLPHHQRGPPESPHYVNPYNPTETYQIKRAKLIQSLRNKMPAPRDGNDYQGDYVHSPSERNSAIEDDYPHPKNGTLKNEILHVRSRMSNKPPAPTDWTKPSRPASTQEHNYPPKDYPAFPGSRNLPQLNRRPYAASQPDYSSPRPAPGAGDNYPSSRPPPGRINRGLSRQEADVMNEYDRTIANEERNFQHPPGFLHSRYPK